jgi:hypothetical protein
VYLTSAFLALLSFLAEPEMSNLRVCSGLDGSITTAPTKSPVDSVAFTALETPETGQNRAGFGLKVDSTNEVQEGRSWNLALFLFLASNVAGRLRESV